jgi:hypothetical protein
MESYGGASRRSGKPACETLDPERFDAAQPESATKSEKTYLLYPVMTETTNNTGLI